MLTLHSLKHSKSYFDLNLDRKLIYKCGGCGCGDEDETRGPA